MPKKELLARIDQNAPGDARIVGGTYLSRQALAIGALTDGVGHTSPDAAGRLLIVGRDGVSVDAQAAQLVLSVDGSIPRLGFTGRQIIGHGATLLYDLPADGAFLTVAADVFRAGDVVLLQARGQREYIGITTTGTLDGDGCAYDITRNRDGSGAVAWRAGDVALRLGQTGEHFIEIAGAADLTGQPGPVVAIRHMRDAEFLDWTPQVLIGNLASSPLYQHDPYPHWGFMAGRFGEAGEPWALVEAGVGVQLGVGGFANLHLTPQGDIDQYAQGEQRSHLDHDGSGWLAGADKLWWDAAGNLHVAGDLTAGPGSTISGAYLTAGSVTAAQIAAGTVTADRLDVSELSAIAADMGSLTAGQIVLGDSNKLWLNDANDGALAIGGASKASAPFRVTAAGALTATAASITGAINATSGTISGALNVTNTLNIGTGFLRIRIDGAERLIRSNNYVTGETGFRIKANGDAEFNNIVARGAITTAVFEKNRVAAFSGSQMVARSASTLTAELYLFGAGSYNIAVRPQAGGAPFAVDDVLHIRTATHDVYFRVAGAVILTLDGNYEYPCTYLSGTADGIIALGETVIDYGPAGAGRIWLTADDAHAPFLSIATHDGADTPTWTEHVRLGQLAGITGQDEYGLWSDNVYLTGSFVANDLRIGPPHGPTLYAGTVPLAGHETPQFGLWVEDQFGRRRIAMLTGTQDWPDRPALYVGAPDDASYMRFEGDQLKVKGDITATSGSLGKFTVHDTYLESQNQKVRLIAESSEEFGEGITLITGPTTADAGSLKWNDPNAPPSRPNWTLGIQMCYHDAAYGGWVMQTQTTTPYGDSVSPTKHVWIAGQWNGAQSEMSFDSAGSLRAPYVYARDLYGSGTPPLYLHRVQWSRTLAGLTINTNLGGVARVAEAQGGFAAAPVTQLPVNNAEVTINVPVDLPPGVTGAYLTDLSVYWQKRTADAHFAYVKLYKVEATTGARTELYSAANVGQASATGRYTQTVVSAPPLALSSSFYYYLVLKTAGVSSGHDLLLHSVYLGYADYDPTA